MPESINICGIPYMIKYCSDDFNTETEHLGAIYYKKCEISIAADMPDELQMQTLIHEWVHGVLFAIGYTELRSDEKFVQNLALAINQTFETKKGNKP